MPGRFEIGDAVQTPFGKGTVREMRNNRRVLVEIRDRSLVFGEDEISPLLERPHASEGRARARPSEVSSATAGADARQTGRVPSEVDLHGLTVAQALDRAEGALNDALLANLPELRFIHGRSSSLIRSALHRWLRGITAVRRFGVDSRNEGVTIVNL
jgi:dsDNA-specific endonuclease/ATPase MutS2